MLAVAYHRLNRIEQVISRCVGIAEFTCCLQVVPGNPKRIFNQCWHRFGHKAKTPSGSTCSFRDPPNACWSRCKWHVPRPPSEQ